MTYNPRLWHKFFGEARALGWSRGKLHRQAFLARINRLAQMQNNPLIDKAVAPDALERGLVISQTGERLTTGSGVMKRAKGAVTTQSGEKLSSPAMGASILRQSRAMSSAVAAHGEKGMGNRNILKKISEGFSNKGPTMFRDPQDGIADPTFMKLARAGRASDRRARLIHRMMRTRLGEGRVH